MGQPALLAPLRWTRLLLGEDFAKDREQGMDLSMGMMEQELDCEMEELEWRSIVWEIKLRLDSAKASTRMGLDSQEIVLGIERLLAKG